MAYSLNKVQLIGNVGKDKPELKYTPSGIAVATFSMATSENWKDQDGNQKEKTEWHKIVAWRKLAEILGEHLKAGSKIYVEGKIQTRSYEKDGTKRYITEIVIDDFIFLDGKNGVGKSNANASDDEDTFTKKQFVDKSSINEDDLPF